MPKKIPLFNRLASQRDILPLRWKSWRITIRAKIRFFDFSWPSFSRQEEINPRFRLVRLGTSVLKLRLSQDGPEREHGVSH